MAASTAASREGIDPITKMSYQRHSILRGFGHRRRGTAGADSPSQGHRRSTISHRRIKSLLGPSTAGGAPQEQVRGIWGTAGAPAAPAVNTAGAGYYGSHTEKISNRIPYTVSSFLLKIALLPAAGATKNAFAAFRGVVTLIRQCFS